MKAVARLIVSSFCSVEWLTIVGAAFGLGILTGLVGSLNSSSSYSVLLARTLEFSFFGAIFLGSMYLPSTYSRLARSRTIDLLPGGRLKLLASTLVTILLVAALVPVAIIDVMKTSGSYGLQNVAYYGRALTALDYVRAPFFWHMFAIAVLAYTWVYAVIWSGARIREHSMVGLPRTLFLLFVPVPFLAVYRTTIADASSATLAMLIAVTWSVFAFFLLLQPRLRRAVEVRPVGALVKVFRCRGIARYTIGNELRAVLGLRSRWTYCLSIGLCVCLLLSGIKSRAWFFFFVVLALAAGGMPAYAAAKCRTLWLRLPSSRTELFLQVETFYWRYALPSIVLLIISFVAIGGYIGLRRSLIAAGIFHGVVSAIASIYLGLMQVGASRWLDAVVAIFTLGIAVLGAVASAGDSIGVLISTALLTALTLAYRVIARRRWTQLDWIVCKPSRVA